MTHLATLHSHYLGGRHPVLGTLRSPRKTRAHRASIIAFSRLALFMRISGPQVVALLKQNGYRLTGLDEAFILACKKGWGEAQKVPTLAQILARAGA